MRSSKTCFKCKKSLPRTEFYKHPYMSDGLLGKCKKCTIKDSKDHRLKNLEKVRQYDRDRAKNPERIKLAREISNRWRNQDKRITRCHNAVARAVRNGTLRATNCQWCGSEKVLAHHESYDRPLDVNWYCQPCHKARHKQMVLEGIEP